MSARKNVSAFNVAGWTSNFEIQQTLSLKNKTEKQTETVTVKQSNKDLSGIPGCSAALLQHQTEEKEAQGENRHKPYKKER